MESKQPALTARQKEGLVEIATLLWWLSLILAIALNAYVGVHGMRMMFVLIAAESLGLIGGMSSVIRAWAKQSESSHE